MKILSYITFDNKLETLSNEEKNLILDYIKLIKTKENQRQTVEDNSFVIKDGVRATRIGPLILLFSILRDKNNNLMILLDIVSAKNET